MPTPTDEKLYESIKKDLFKKYKPSAYRSGLLVQKYKEEYVKKHKNKNYYSGTKENSNLKRWFDEKWQNQRGEIGYQKKTDVYRPTIRINDKTPTTFNELTKNQIKKAMNEKARTRRVKKFLS
jgi:Family of unknown function (DUF5872)